ncbi:acetyltransferase [Bacillus sp. 1NLA3E]|uniref:acetyltransferase n=1 Tax=Bacillus sp. 1NLA3E TaxID=666686 RepID=UPI000247F024|nr:acetyltransferase [Bacillus sp. 1NLA3E]AGK53943.1 GCN5 N-acetyltransferase [Bacillus sp. 1NLA3E]
MTTLDNLEIRSLHSVAELEEVRALESKIWGPQDSIPTHQTITSVKNGGLVLGAYVDEQLIAFQYSFPGFNGRNVYLCSHVLATDPHFRSKGIGEKLKIAQREEARKLGYELITWTYDPLESVNGYLNIGKLAAVSSTYIPNCYGEMDDLLNGGIPSDRFLVEWQIQLDSTSGTPEQEVEGESYLKNSLIQFEIDHNGLPIPMPTHSLPRQTDQIVSVAIPKNFREIKKINIETAILWRMKTREIFIELFREGWQVSGFKKNPITESPVNYYILTKK